MKKIIFKAVMMVVVMVGMSNYAMYLMTGKSPLQGFSLSSLMPSKIDMPDLSMPDVGLSESKPVSVHKWVDERGVVHYSQQAPAGEKVAEATVVTIDPATVNSIEQPPSIPAFKKSNSMQTDGSLSPGDTLPTPGNIQQVMQEARNVQKKMDERNAQMEEIMEQL